jgi:hypothetical protein
MKTKTDSHDRLSYYYATRKVNSKLSDYHIEYFNVIDHIIYLMSGV